MAKHDKYHPDYGKLYPGVKISPEVLAALRQSDQKMKYIEMDIKTERLRYSKKIGGTVVLPSREDSYERLCEEDGMQFSVEEETVEDNMIRTEELRSLRAALLKLESDESTLIHALFFEGLSERKLSKLTGIPQRTIHDRKKKILVKLHKLMKN